MSQATAEKSTPLIPPDERFWQRYSPHHEFPLSSVASLALHGLVIGTMLLAGWWMSRRWQDDLAKPPSMDVVQVEGGTGLEGLGGGSGLPGPIDPGGAKKEFVELNPNVKQFKADPTTPRLKDPILTPEKLPEVAQTDPDLSTTEFDDIAKDADKVLRNLMKIPTSTQAATKVASKGPPGEGKGTGPLGPGRGFKQGPGTGTGGPPGRPQTRQDILAWRWRFDLAGDGKEHAKKLDAMGVIVGLPDGRGGIVVARNLKQRPVKLQNENLEPYKDAVKWYNTKADSLFKLAQELRIPLPQFVVLLLPKEREDKMAAAEQEYTRRQGRRLEEVQATWFDFRFRNGTYEPEVIRQEYAQ